MKPVLQGLLCCLVLVAAAIGEAEPLGAGRDFLFHNQGPTGAFGEATAEEAFVTTAEALEALRALGLGDTRQARDAESFFAVSPVPADSETQLRRTLALAGTPWLARGQALVADALGFDEADPLHLALSLRALAVPGALPTQNEDILALKLAQRARPSGCFGYADNNDSVELTAQAVLALQRFPHLPSAAAAVGAAAACLEKMQDAGGSFGSAPDTAAAVLALTQMSGQHTTAVNLGRGSLVATQSTDGSWGGSVRATALALRALSRNGPDWRMTTSDTFRQPVLYLANPEPLQGQDIQVSFTVENRSAFSAPSTSIRFFARPVSGGPETTLTDTTLLALAPGEKRAVNTLVSSSQLAGRYTLRAMVDPDGLVPELDEFNNEATASVNVRQENDLAVAAGSIAFADIGGGQVRVDVAVKNLGIPLPTSVAVDVYRGPPNSGGVKLGTGTIPAGLLPNTSSTVSVTWNTASANGPTPIYAVVDPQNLLPEADETNNQTFRFYFPGAGAPVDLAITANDISFSPPAGVADQPFTVTAVVHNLSAKDANRVPVSAALAGTTVALTEVGLVPANGTATASFRLSGVRTSTVSITIDPDHLLNDTNRGNNSASNNISIVQSAPVEWVAKSFTANPGNAQNGTPVTFTFVFQNTGASAANTHIQIWNETENEQLALMPVAVPGLPPGQTITNRTVTFSFSAPPSATAYKACVDPFNADTEVNENDNCLELTLSSQTSSVSIHPRDIICTPVGADVGEKVTAQATVRNASSQPATAVVEWWHGRPDLPEGTRLGATPVSMPAQGAGVATFEWVRTAGAPEIFARLTQIIPSDSNLTDNVAGRHLFLESIINLGLPQRYTTGTVVRVGRVTGNAKPELAVGYEAFNSNADLTSGVALLRKADDGSYVTLWQRPALQKMKDIVLADLDNDGTPEVTALTLRFGSSTTPATVQITALKPDGSTKWQQSFPHGSTSSYLGNDDAVGTLSVGDVNADAIADVVYVDPVNVKVFSGDDGHVLLSVVHTTVVPAIGPTRSVVLDVDGDGTNEILVYASQQLFLFNSDGTPRWKLANLINEAEQFSVVDLDLDGKPEIVFPRHKAYLRAVDGTTGAVKTTASYPAYFSAPFPVGQLRQDGLTYPVVGDNCCHDPSLTAFNPDLTQLWQWTVYSATGENPLNASLSDLYGLGRPQIVAVKTARPPILLDGRDGREIVGPGALSTSNGAPTELVYYTPNQPAVVADVDGNGRSNIVLGANNQSLDVWDPEGINYGKGEVHIFSSVHWTKQPAVWASHDYLKGRIDEALHVSTDYRWWTTHNTWNQQFDDTPAKLLPDLVVAAADMSASPATPGVGTATTLAAVIRNRGGLPASNVRVSFYDGNPEAGGSLLGTTTVVGPLAVRGGTATAQVPWTAYPEGEHRIYVTANSDGAMEESGRDNNTAFLRMFVQSGVPLCDVALDTSSLSASPSAPAPGDGFSLSATVRNTGPLACAASQLSVYDGAKSTGGPLVGTANIAPLASGASATLQVSLSATPGTHPFRFIADESQALLDTDRSNNEASFSLFVPPSPLPDLFVSALSASPNPAYPGEAVTLTASVRNLGAPSPASGFSVHIGGTEVAAGTAPALLSGETTTVTATLRAPTATSLVDFAVDSAGAVAEFNEKNNSAQTTLSVTDSGVALTGSAKPNATGPQTSIALTFAVQNTGAAAQDVTLKVSVVSPDGTVVASPLVGTRLVVESGTTNSANALWNTGSAVPGVYLAHAVLQAGSRTLRTVDLPITVQAEGGVSSALLVDKGTYAPGDAVLIRHRLTNRSRNAVLAGANLHISIQDSAGTVLYTSDKPIASLPPTQAFDSMDVFSVAPSLSPGSYVARSEVTSGAQQLASGQASWQVAYQPAQTLAGTLSASSPFGLQAPLAVTLQLANAGAVNLTGGALQLRLLQAGSLAVESTYSAAVSVPAGQSQAVNAQLSTSGVSPGQKLLVAQVDGKTVDTLPLVATQVVDTNPPVISVSGVSDLLFTNHNVTPVVTVQDESPVQVTSLLDGQTFVSGTAVTAEGTHTLAVDATDSAGNHSQRIVHFTLDKTAPVISVVGVADAAFQNAPATVAFSAADANPDTVTATLDGASFASGGTVSAQGIHTLVVAATDKAGNSSSQTVHFTLDFTPPQISVGGVVDGAFRNAPVTITFTVSDANPDTVTATLDGANFTSGGTVSTQGAHTLVVAATDKAGNKAPPLSVHFTLDFTLPVVSVAGVTEGATSDFFDISFSGTDTNLAAVTATLDGASFTSGTRVSSVGHRRLVVTAKDKAGNTATTTVNFVVVAMRPLFSYAVCSMTSLSLAINSAVLAPSGPASVAANGDVTLSNSSAVTGDVVSGRNATLQDNAAVAGKVYHGGTYTRANNASSAGDVPVSPAPVPCECGYDVTQRLSIASVHNDNAALLPTLAPYFVNGGLELRNAALTLPGGRLYLTHVLLAGTSSLTVASGQTAELFVTGNVEVSNLSTLGTPSSAVGTLLVVSGANSTRGGVVTVQNHADAALQLYAPLADVALENNTRIYGAVAGKSVSLRNHQSLSFSGTQAVPPPLRCP